MAAIQAGSGRARGAESVIYATNKEWLGTKVSFLDNLSEEAKESLRQGLLALSRAADRHAEEMGAIYRKRHAEQLAEREEVEELERLYAMDANGPR